MPASKKQTPSAVHASIPPVRDIRDSLFGDAPLELWPASVAGGDLEPWASFIEAREAMAAGDVKNAIAAWQRVVTIPKLESRHYVQAWHFLRANGVQPPADQAKRLLGVVLEVPLEGGLDLLAAYPERNARYYNQAGGGVVWERADASLDGKIDALLTAGQRVLNAIGPWEGARPGPPPAGQVRINFLAPSGLHFGQAPFQVFAGDALAKPVIDSGVALMQALIEKQGGR